MTAIFNQIYNLINGLFDFSAVSLAVEEASIVWVTGLSFALTILVAIFPVLLVFRLIRRFI